MTMTPYDFGRRVGQHVRLEKQAIGFGDVGKGLQNFGKSVGQAAQGYGHQLNSFYNPMSDAFHAPAGPHASDNWIRNIGRGAAVTAGVAGAGAAGLAAAAPGVAAMPVSQIPGAVAGAAGSAYNAAGNLAAQAGGRVVGGATAAGGWLANQAQSGMNSINNGISGATDFANGVYARGLNALPSVPEPLQQVGEHYNNVVEQLDRNGMSSHAEFPMQLREFGEKTVEPLAHAFGGHGDQLVHAGVH